MRHFDPTWLLAAVVVVVIVVALGARLGVRPLMRLRDWSRRWLRIASVYVRQAPLTFLYLLLVFVTTWIVLGVGSRMGDALLTMHSSSLRILLHHPLRGLVQSAFWLEYPAELLSATAFAVLLAPVERWLGSLRWLAVAVAGQFGATLAVAVVIWAFVDAGWVPASTTTGVDVGVSYAFGAVAGVFTWRIHGRRRVVYAGVILAILIAAVPVDQTFTDLGHVFAFTIGLGLGLVPLTRTPEARARLSEPIYLRPWKTVR